MLLKKWLRPLVPEPILARRRGRIARESIERFTFGDATPAEARQHIRECYGYDGDLLASFPAETAPFTHKWHHYIPLYDRYFAPFRGQKVRMLEIGVNRGGSLRMWRDYFGEDAIIFGIDINPECAALDGRDGAVRIGSQTDNAFLASVVKEMGGVDIVLDDGSHQMAHVTHTLQQLFGHLNDGGIYLIEDLHTAYWKRFGGGYGSKKNFFSFLTEIVDDLHHWYHTRRIKHPAISPECSGIHIHDSLVVLEKKRVHPPAHSGMP